jgi:predicted SnoaL-like aldol condensation-catalyzing enzyme
MFKNTIFLIAALAIQPMLAAAQPLAGGTEANKKLALDFFRVVFEAENIAAAKNYLPENYIQHNPRVAGGLKGFVDYFGPKWKTPKPVKPELSEPPASVVAEGDLVTIMWKTQRPEPKDKTKTYDAFWFDMFRVENGKLAEHWDNAVKQ